MKHQKPEFNWKLYEFSREELGLSATLTAAWPRDGFADQPVDENHVQYVDRPKPAGEIRG